VRVLVTGAAGSIGTVVVAGLIDRGHSVVALDRLRSARGRDVERIVGDVLDPEVTRPALDGTDAVVHLAAIPAETLLPLAIEAHVLTTAVVLDAMVATGVNRLVYASSNHAVGSTPRVPLLTDDVRPRPDSFYGVGKVAAEALCSMYADHHGIDTVACRIGSFLARPVSRRHLSTWLSHADAVRMVEAAISTDTSGFAALYGISANTRAWWDLEPGRALGYHPEDDAEQYAARVLRAQETDEDAAEAAFVGGPWAVGPPSPASA
jgi:uronate dehydrogenase